MGFAPKAITEADFSIIQKPDYGGEMDVLLSTEEGLEYGSFEITAVNSGVFTPDAVNELPANGADLVAVVEGRSLVDDANVVLTLTGTDQDSQALTGTATFAPPDYARVQRNVFPPGYAVDIVPSTPGKRFKTITSIASTNTIRAQGNKISIWTLPALDTFELVGCTTDKDFSTKARPSRAIACGMDGSAFTKQGRSEPAELNITAKVLNFGDGLYRYNGATCTVLLKVTNEEKVEAVRHFLSQYTPTVRPTYGDGEAEATIASTGFYEDLITLVAPSA